MVRPRVAGPTDEAPYSRSLQKAFSTQSSIASVRKPTATMATSPDWGHLVLDRKGNLYGTTYLGAAHDQNICPWGCGVVFKLTPEGKETVLYSFCAQTNCTDGAQPYGGLVLDEKGNLYGTTVGGGAYNNGKSCYGIGCGVVFKLTPKGKRASPPPLLSSRQWQLHGRSDSAGRVST